MAQSSRVMMIAPFLGDSELLVFDEHQWFIVPFEAGGWTRRKPAREVYPNEQSELFEDASRLSSANAQRIWALLAEGSKE